MTISGMNRLNFDQLRAVLTVVRLGSVRKAASALNITQPAVSTRIRNLEDALGCEIFDRSANGMRLTRRGELLLAHAERIEYLVDRVGRDVADPATLDGRLRLGVSETIAQCWLPDLVTALHDNYPSLEIEFNVDISVNLRNALLDREIDLALLLGPVSEFSVDNITLPEFELAWYAAASLGDRHLASEADVFARPVITYARNTRPFRELKSRLFERIGPDVALFPSSSLSACFRLVAANLGVAALPRRLAEPYLAEGSIREFDPGWVPDPLTFTASYLDEPGNSVVVSAARLARDVALQ